MTTINSDGLLQRYGNDEVLIRANGRSTVAQAPHRVTTVDISFADINSSVEAGETTIGDFLPLGWTNATATPANRRTPLTVIPRGARIERVELLVRTAFNTATSVQIGLTKLDGTPGVNGATTKANACIQVARPLVSTLTAGAHLVYNVAAANLGGTVVNAAVLDQPAAIGIRWLTGGVPTAGALEMRVYWNAVS